jgi:hypothetical protein
MQNYYDYSEEIENNTDTYLSESQHKQISIKIINR